MPHAVACAAAWARLVSRVLPSRRCCSYCSCAALPAQEKDAKTLKELRKNNDKLRAQAASKRGGRGSSRRAVSTSRGGLVGFVLSWKGAVALGTFAYLFLQQRTLLEGLLKYPLWFSSWLLRSVWTMALKPVVRFVVLRGKGGGELPGGSY